MTEQDFLILSKWMDFTIRELLFLLHLTLPYIKSNLLSSSQ